MTDRNVIHAVNTCAVLFAGIGGATRGFMDARMEYGGRVHRFQVLCAIDSDPVACMNHDLITGEKTALVMDLFTRWQYEAWHGHAPPPEWREMTTWDLWLAFQQQVPDFLFTSPPCKGLSGLLPNEKAKSNKYQALNHLTIRGLELSLRACKEYGGKLPSIIQLENVPRITTRGAGLLKQIKKLLKSFGYEINIRSDHNLGEIGGLGQNRVRFLIVARNVSRMPNYIDYPEKRPLQTIGDVLQPLPFPGDVVAGGPLHRLPNLQWKTWMRLALISAGGDWRDLQSVDYEHLRVVHTPRRGAFEVADWHKTSRTVTGSSGPGQSNGVTSVSDPRLKLSGEGKTNLFRVQSLSAPATCVTGAAGVNQGAGCIADPALTDRASRHPAAYRVVRVHEPAPCITGTRFGSGAIAVADPRIPTCHKGASASIVTDPSLIPNDTDRGVYMIMSVDGTWHRPLTTYELAMLQGFPMHLPDGRPFQLVGCADGKAREFIGNAVPRGAAESMGEVFLLAFAQAAAGKHFSMSLNAVWVIPAEYEPAAILQ